mgnify:CR=1 FL=1
MIVGVVAWRPDIRHAARRRAVDAEGERAVAVVHDDLDHRAVRSALQVGRLPGLVAHDLSVVAVGVVHGWGKVEAELHFSDGADGAATVHADQFAIIDIEAWQ